MQLNKQEQRPVKQLTEQEREEAIELLQSQDLLKKTNELIGLSCKIGEEIYPVILSIYRLLLRLPTMAKELYK